MNKLCLIILKIDVHKFYGNHTIEYMTNEWFSFCDIYSIKEPRQDHDGLLRKLHYECNSDSMVCPPCSAPNNKHLPLLSLSPDGYGICVFNGTILTIPQTYDIRSNAVISAMNKNTFVMAILEDINEKENSVSVNNNTHIYIYIIRNK